ncbi:MAG: spore coat protein [Clostridia bacterium]|nr:spore coat protein [Clostridia bacterium]
MPNTFTQKETSLLQDLKKSEQLCVDKYTKYENNAVSTELKSLMGAIKQQEQEHLQTVNQLLGGQVPQVGGGQSGSSKIEAKSAFYNNGTPEYENDKFVCSDALATEKYVSSVYDVSIFEFKDPAVRNVLNHLQKEEQTHGEKIYSFMDQNGMYS